MSRSIRPQNKRDLNQGPLHIWSKFGDPSLNGSWVIARTCSWLTDRKTHTLRRRQRQYSKTKTGLRWKSAEKIGIPNSWNANSISLGAFSNDVFMFVVGQVAMGEQPMVVVRWTSLSKYSECNPLHNRLHLSQCLCFDEFNHKNWGFHRT